MDEYVYIYRITCNNQCYVGQSNRKQDATSARPYGRLEEHVKVGWKMWTKAGESPMLKNLFRTQNLRDIKIELYDESKNFGISAQDYEKFLEIFSPDPATQYTYQQLPLNIKIDIAEILHVAYAALKFGSIGNVSVGGQHYAWYFINSQQIAFTRRFTPNDFLGLIASKEKLKQALKDVAIKQYELNIKDEKTKLYNIIKTHWDKKKKQNNLNWKEFTNMLKKHDSDFYQILKSSVNEFLHNFKNAWNSIDIGLDIDINLNPTLLLKEITKQLGETLGFETRKANIKDNFEIPVNQFVYANLNFENTKWEKKDLGFIQHLTIWPGDTEAVQDYLKKWTANLFKSFYDKVKNENFYQDLYANQPQNVSTIQDGTSTYATIKRGHYKKYRSLGYEIQVAYLDKGLQMPFITNEWYLFYTEEMNLLMKKFPFSYTEKNGKIYAYHNTPATVITLTDNEAQNAIILTRVYNEGDFDNPTDYKQLTIY